MPRHRKWVVLGFAVIAGVYLWTRADPPMPPIHGDGYYTWLWARSLVFDGDWDLTNDYELCGDPWRMRTRMGPPEPGMRPHNPWNPGPALLWAPFLFVLRHTLPEADDPNPKVAQACQGRMAELSMLGTVLAGLITVWLAYRFARRHVGPGGAFLGAAAVALATSLPYYATLLPSYNHGPAAFGAAIFLERWDGTRGNRRGWRWPVLGALLGLAMLMRAQNALLAICPLLEWIALARDDVHARRWKSLAALVGLGFAFVAGALLLFSPQPYLWKLTYGTYFAVPQGEHFMRWETPHVDGVLWGSTGGLLVWTPILYFAFLGLFGGLLSREKRFVCLTLLLVVAAYTYVNASAYDYFGSAGFSNRRFTAVALPFAFGIALSADWAIRLAKRRPRAFAVATMCGALLLFAGWNYGAMWGVAGGEIPSHRERPMLIFWKQTFDQISEGVWQNVGNPFAWPASVPFAIRYDAHPRTWDVMRGMAVFYQNEQTREPRTGHGENEARFGRPYQFHYAVEGFEQEARTVDGRRAAVTTGKYARMLIPFFWDDVEAIEVRWKTVREPGSKQRSQATVALEWNGVPITQSDVASRRWQTTRITMPPGAVRIGINEVEWHVNDGPIAFEAIEVFQIPREHVPASVR